MAAACGASSSGQQSSLGDLHRFVMDVAANRVGIPALPSGFIGPARPTSTFLGEETILASPASEPTVQIMFRCTWGPSTQSRHVLITMNPSMSERALALRLCQVFDIPTTGGVFIEPVLKWMPGCMQNPSTWDDGIPLEEVAQKLGSTLSGIIDLHILMCEEQFGGCTLCKNMAILTAPVVRNARTWAIGEATLCGRCAQNTGIA